MPAWISRCIVAAVFLSVSPAALADDAALAERIFEQKRKAREIVQWAEARAWEAVLNSPTGRASAEKVAEFEAQCEALAANAAERGDAFEITPEECVKAHMKLDSPHSDVMAELRATFIRERLEEEQERLEDELFDGLRRRLQESQGLSDGSII